jgi:hypothetical protein
MRVCVGIIRVVNANPYPRKDLNISPMRSLVLFQLGRRKITHGQEMAVR